MTQANKIKLIKKTSKNYLISGIILVLISVISLFFITQYFIQDETDESLYSTLYTIEKLIDKNPKTHSIKPLIEIKESDIFGNQKIKDTLIFDPAQNEIETFRELSSYKKINGKNYKVSVRTLLVDSDDIIIAILVSYLGIILILFLSQYYFNKINTKIIWRPFFENLAKIKTFSLQSNQKIILEKTNILEFSELNDEIISLTDKVVTDYQNLKQFTEDVSHEIQTPLSIIQAKIGNLIDENQITEKQFKLLTDIQQNAYRLASLNKKLILLAKIENQQFKSLKKIDLSVIVQQSIQNFEGLGDVIISSGAMEKTEVSLDKNLAQILIDNLISNAVKYTSSQGKIDISITNHKLIIANSGKQAISEPQKLYDRFYRENTTKKSLGLGLAIVKKICDNQAYTINYTFKNNSHIFTVNFS